MPRPPAFSRPRFRQLPGSVLLALALLWAQLLGLAHGVLHGHGVPARVELSAQGAGQGHEAHEAHAVHDTHGGLLAHLLAPADEGGECRLYDQLGQGAVSAQALPALPTALPLLPAWVALRALPPHPCAAFAARAPPASR